MKKYINSIWQNPQIANKPFSILHDINIEDILVLLNIHGDNV